MKYAASVSDFFQAPKWGTNLLMGAVAFIIPVVKAAFDLAFVRDFLSRVWMEMLVTMLFLAGLGLCLMIITVVTCYIGLFFAAPVLMFSWHHLQKQLYQLYLARGGAPVLPSPKLNDLPPPLPGA
jgi:hypothetical protein